MKKETNAALLSAEDEVERLVRHAALFSASHCMAMPFQCAACGTLDCNVSLQAALTQLQFHKLGPLWLPR